MIEDYTDADAATRHNIACADLLRRLGEVAELVSADLLGDLDEPVVARGAGLGGSGVRQGERTLYVKGGLTGR